MRIEGETGFVLHARPWRETSLLVEVLSAGHGRIGLVARGVQSPKRQVLRAALQPLQHIRFDAVMAGELAQLRAAEALDAAPQLGGDARHDVIGTVAAGKAFIRAGNSGKDFGRGPGGVVRGEEHQRFS